MLPARHRLRHSGDFARAIRSGGRGGGRYVVVHLSLPDGDLDPTHTDPARVGLVVSKAVGGAVQRNLVKRRLREIAREHVPGLGAGELVVVRALPEANGARFQELREDAARSLGVARARALRRQEARRPKPDADEGPR